MVQDELPRSRQFWGDSFGIEKLVGVFYSYDDVPFDDMESMSEIDRDLLDELTHLAQGGRATAVPSPDALARE